MSAYNISTRVVSMRADMFTIVQPAGGGAVTVSWRFTASAAGFATGVGAGIAAAKPSSRTTALMSRDIVKEISGR